MPDESCRTCGGELVKCSLCSECRKVIQKICRMCNLRTNEEIHPQCLYVETYQTRNEANIAVLGTNNFNSKKTHSYKKNHHFENLTVKKLLIFGLIGIFAMGISSVSYNDVAHQLTNMFQDNKATLKNENQPIGTIKQVNI